MNDLVRKMSTHIILQSVISVLLGLFLIIWPKTTTVTLIYVMAAFLAVMGLVTVIGYLRSKTKSSTQIADIVSGVFELIIALIFFLFPQSIASFFSVLIGILVILNSVLNIVRSIEIKKAGGNQWMAVLVLNLLVAAGGVLIIVKPFASAVAFVLLMGIVLVIKGIVDLVSGLMFTHSLKKLGKEM